MPLPCPVPLTAAAPGVLAWLLCAAPLPALAGPASPGDSRGRLLYETHCIECHTTQMHWRQARQARDWPSLYRQVALWQQRAGQRWPAEDIEAVVRHLNTTIYRFPVPAVRAGMGVTGAGG